MVRVLKDSNEGPQYQQQTVMGKIYLYGVLSKRKLHTLVLKINYFSLYIYK
jgi:hypothetical protein